MRGQVGDDPDRDIRVVPILDTHDVGPGYVRQIGQLLLRQTGSPPSRSQIRSQCIAQSVIGFRSPRGWRCPRHTSGGCGHVLDLCPHRYLSPVAYSDVLLQWCLTCAGIPLVSFFSCWQPEEVIHTPKFRFSLTSNSSRFSVIDSACCGPYPLAKGRFPPSKRAAGSLANGRLSPSKRAVRPAMGHSVASMPRVSTQMLMSDTTQAARLLVNPRLRCPLTSCHDSLLGDRTER